MAHIRVKYLKGGKFEVDDLQDSPDLKKWHLYAAGIGDGEFTACGNAVVDYDHKTEKREKGGITCPRCLETIKYYKQILI